MEGNGGFRLAFLRGTRITSGGCCRGTGDPTLMNEVQVGVIDLAAFVVVPVQGVVVEAQVGDGFMT